MSPSAAPREDRTETGRALGGLDGVEQEVPGRSGLGRPQSALDQFDERHADHFDGCRVRRHARALEQRFEKVVAGPGSIHSRSERHDQVAEPRVVGFELAQAARAPRLAADASETHRRLPAQLQPLRQRVGRRSGLAIADEGPCGIDHVAERRSGELHAQNHLLRLGITGEHQRVRHVDDPRGDREPARVDEHVERQRIQFREGVDDRHFLLTCDASEESAQHTEGVRVADAREGVDGGGALTRSLAGPRETGLELLVGREREFGVVGEQRAPVLGVDGRIAHRGLDAHRQVLGPGGERRVPPSRDADRKQCDQPQDDGNGVRAERSVGAGTFHQTGWPSRPTSSSRLASRVASLRASRFSRRSGSVFDARTLNHHQSGSDRSPNSTVTPSRSSCFPAE
jgi:hypothetical protein